MTLSSDLIINQSANSNVYIGDIFANKGLYTTAEINAAKFSKFSRFGRVLDGQGKLSDVREYLFFTKPDLHIVVPDSSSMTINSELEDNDYFYDLVTKYPDVVRELQLSAPGNNKNPFGHLMSFCVNGNLSLPGIEASIMDTPSTMFGTSIEYLGNAQSSDENPTFSLEFVDSKELELYHFFKGYQEYHIARKSGTVSPIRKYIYSRRLHNAMGCYKFLISEDMETIIHWSYFWGVFPVSAPREAFSNSSFPEGLTYSVDFKAAWVDDMKPSIIQEFNNKMRPLVSGKTLLPIHELNSDRTINPMGDVIGTLPTAAYISESGASKGHNGRSKYKFNWYV